MWIFIVAISIALFLWHLNKSDKTKRFMELASKLKGVPKPLPIIGNALEFGTDSQEFLNNINRIGEKYGDACAVWIGRSLYVVITSAENMEIILGSKVHVNKPPLYEHLKAWLGSGLTTAQGELWWKHRKLITPAFHFKILENYVEIFESNFRKMANDFEVELTKEEFDVQPYTDKYTLYIISETAMATKIGSEMNELEFQKAINQICFAVLYRSFKPWLSPDIIYNWSSAGATFHKSVKIIQDFVLKIVLKRKEERNKMGNLISQKEDNISFGYKKRIAFLDLLLEFASSSKNSLTDQEILDEVNTFMFAGHDTTTSSISFILYLLSRHPEVQEKVVKEIQEAFGDLSDKPCTMNNLSSMKYLERVIKETLRLYPSVPFIGRTVNEEVTLHKGEILPSGCHIAILFQILHQDPNVFPNPEEFNPDNFLPEKMVGRHPYAYCPFSAGPKNCLGQKFAMLELKTAVVCILRKYFLLPGKTDIKLATELVLRSATGMHIAIKNRNAS